MRSAGLENYFGSLKADTHIREILMNSILKI